MIFSLPMLSALIWLPILGGFLIFVVGGDQKPYRAKRIALVTSLLCLMLCAVLIGQFDGFNASMQFKEKVEWLPLLDIQYALGVDGFSVPLIVLTCLLTPLVVISAWRVIEKKVAHYMAAFLIMQGLMCGVFAALDGILFYIFWEGMLIPMFLIIGIWGGPNRIYATIKFFLFTFFGSVFLLVSLIYLHYLAQKNGLSDPFSILTFHQLPMSLVSQKWLFFGFLLAFAVKVPMWPVHTWLPDAHVEAPTGGSVMLAAIMLKMGAYGFLRFLLPIVPDACRELQGFIIALSLIAILYIGLVAIVQQDMKKLIAYSSVAHMGFVTLGIILVFNLLVKGNYLPASMGMEGAFVQMISHGFISAALFLCVGVLYDRVHSRKIADYGGVVNTMPIFASFFVLFALANAGLPGTSGFVGEFLVILSAFQANMGYAVLAASILILGASYSLWMIKRVVFGPVGNNNVAVLVDINSRELIYLSILAGLVLGFGIWPQPLLNVTHASVAELLQHISRVKLV